MIKLTDLMNEWDEKVGKNKKRWTKPFGGPSGLTEFEESGGKDNVNEENEGSWTIIYKGLLSGFRKAKTKNLESVAKGVAFLIKTEYGRGALNDFLKLVKKNLK